MARLIPVDYDPFENKPTVKDWPSVADKIGQEEGLPPGLWPKVIQAESNWNHNRPSPKGARGFAQLMPDTAKALNINIDDPEDNLRGGARYLKQNLDKYGDVKLALAAYNAGPGNVDKYGGIPPFKETQNYVKTITGTTPKLTPVDYDPFAKEETPIKPQQELPSKPTMFSKMGDALSNRAENIRNIEQYAKEGTDWERMKRSPGYAIRTLGEIAGGVNDVISPLIGEAISRGTGYHNIPEEQRKAIADTIIQSRPVQAVGKGIQYAQENYPVASQMAEDVLNIGSLLPTGAVFSKGAGTVAGMTGRRIEKGILDDVVKYVKKDVTKMGKEGTEAAVAGKVTGGGHLKQIELKTTPEDVEMANLVSDVVNPRGNAYKNIDNIQDKISKRAFEVDNIVLNKDANAIKIGAGEQDSLIPYFDKAKQNNEVVFGKDKTITDTYDSVIDLFQKERAKQADNLSGIYKARQNMDKRLREIYGPDALEKDAKGIARKVAMQDIHEQVANFISDTLPEGNQFKRLLKDEALLYKAKRHIGFNNPPVVSKNLWGKISHFAHEHPFAIAAGLGGTGFATGMITSPAIMGALAAYGTYKVGKTVITNRMVRSGMAKALKNMEKVLTGSEKAEIKNVIKLMDDSERNIKGRKALPPGNPNKLYDETISIDPTGKARVGDYGRYVDEVNSPYMAGTQQENISQITSPFLPATTGSRSVVPQGGARSIYPPPITDYVGNVRKPELTREQLLEILMRNKGK
jgi:hypothetical protein